ncbi:UNVERIFIED_CONTAM: hypothetical protein GTU68_001155, partial [Idotea baltica]|nr:hypothetical protein [Idotea baltica]
MNTTNFINDNFVLQSEIAETLYHDYAKDLPIIDYHNHLSPKLIAEDNPIKNITDAWLDGDHYKWRAMRANGINEIFITGSASSKKEKFLKWAETVPYTLRNPLFHWTHLELKRYFNINEILQPETAERIYEEANGILENKTPAQLLEDLKVEIVCTTDDPTDDLKYHQQIANGDFYTRVLPTFRADELFFINKEKFSGYLKKLGEATNLNINNLDAFLEAIDKRIQFFNEQGCKLSDFGVGEALEIVDFSKDDVAAIFSKKLSGEELSQIEVNKYRSLLFIHLGKKYHEYDWVQQYHLGPI